VTFSIIARDERTDELGGAVLSHYFSVGTTVLSARPGAGIVTTQMIPDPSYGSRGLDRMAQGATAAAALDALLPADPAAALRQIAILDARGGTAAHTGAHCIAHAGHVHRDGASAQGAMLKNPGLWDVVLDSFERTSGTLAERLLCALEAGAAHGGDIRGHTSAALVVVAARATDQPWHDRRIDLRVEDHREPLTELRRLVRLHALYERANHAFDGAFAGAMPEALSEFARLETDAFSDPEIALRHAILLALAGDIEGARGRLEPCYRLPEDWRELVRRLVPAGFLPSGPGIVERLTG
jgi:uncharacterized Ntn-hydrolase superfamily protein